MKIETLKQRNKRPFIIGTVLLVVIGGALTYKLTHSKYRVTQSIDLGSGVINYVAPDFQIAAIKISTDKVNYSDTDTVPTSGYTLNTSQSTCKVGDIVDSNITIEYSNGKINFRGASQKRTKCYLYFDKQPTASETILANLGNTIKTTTPDFSQTATNDEGVYSTTDGTNMYSGTTYYWRGAATTNHVIFANKCWRIVRINGDKTMRLIYNGGTVNDDGKTCADFGSGAVVYSSTASDRYYATSGGDSNNASYVGWTYSLGSQRTLSGTDSNAKYQTEKWYDNNIGNNATYSGKVAEGKFCNDRNMASGSSFPNGGTESTTQNYAARERLYTNKAPSFNCNAGDVYTLEVGAITADEVAFAGGVYGQTNGSYYLKGDNHYWTMSPSYWYSSGYAHVLFVSSYGSFGDNGVSDARGLRPVINLRSDVSFSSGNGEQNSPYIVSY